ncbi:Glycosylphosphatidylinositol anchor biosynthesis protein 11 [Teratosphaeria destructans]|uniref:Glycosylphosphatidylinositol anchor biosynthesis protein 11 n=1 Tax=Teratosphaeria destructans TaxID=418781 RepID=A0A9W7W0W0_9PEZI|nr:Glycosylphosphatidylinositol anchor biosynthesis protein 11 [Teratosphaeria destructans]
MASLAAASEAEISSSPAKPIDILPAKPIDILPNQIATLYANLHPVLLLSIVLVNFRLLVQDPVSTLAAVAPITGLLQAVYCVLCLPSTGQAPPPKPGQKKKTTKNGQDVWARIVPAFLSSVLTLTLSTPLLYIVLILFGAPLTTHHPQTLLLALHLALLTTPQLFYAHGLDAQTWLRIASLQLPVDEVYGMGLGACAGAWVGAIPIPLDWDREWQKWPVTVLVGLYMGAMVGKVLCGFVFKGWRIQLR